MPRRVERRRAARSTALRRAVDAARRREARRPRRGSPRSSASIDDALARLQQRRQPARQRRRRLRRRALVRRRDRRAAYAGRGAGLSGPPLRGAVRRHRARGARRSRAPTGACSRRSRGAAPRSSAWSRAGGPSSSSRSRRATSRATIRGRAFRAASTSARGASTTRRDYFVGGARGLDDRLCRAPSMRGISASTGSAAGAASRRRADAGHARWTTSAGRCRRRSARCCSRSRRCTGRRRALSRYTTATRRRDAVRRRRTRRGPNRIDLDGAPVDVGFSIDLTIDPALQALAQRVAACYTGRDDVCRALGIARKEDAGARASGSRLLEHAHGAHGGGRDHRRRERPHRGARRRDVAVHAPGVRRPGPRGAVRHAPAVSDPLSARRAAESGRVPRRDAGVDDQADHGGGVPVRSAPTARGWLAGERAEIARAATAVPTRRRACAGSSRARTPRASSTACSAPTGTSRRCARPWEIQAMALAFGWNAGCAQPSDAMRQARPAVRARRRDARRGRRRARARARHRRTAGCWPSRSDGTLGAPFQLARRVRARPREGAAVRRRRRRPPAHAATTGGSAAARSRRRRRRGLGPGPRARERARRRGHDGGARRRGERPGRGARAASGRRACAASAPTAGGAAPRCASR